jgi:uncharacterized membrane protein
VTPDPLDLPATPFRVRAAAQAAALSPAALERALEIATATPDGADWRRFLTRALTLFGAALVLAGVVCFFAYNWDRIGRFGKFALIEAGIVAAALVGWWRLPRLSGQIAITAAAVLVGPLLGVYGQTYQTGADPYGLFLTWALLIVPWVIAARFTALWVIEVVLVDVALALWWSQVVRPTWSYGDFAVGLIVGLVHGAAVVGWEWQMRRREPWLTEKWGPHELALFGFIALLITAASFILQPTEPRYHGGAVNVVNAVGLALLIGSIAATFWYHQQVRPDRFMVTAAGAAGLALGAVVVGRLVMVDLDMEGFGLLLVALFVIAEITYGLRWLRETRPPGHGSEA